MTKHKVILRLRGSNMMFMKKPAKLSKEYLNYLRFYLNKVKNRNTMVIAHEQWVLTRFLRLDILELILLLSFMNFGAMNN
jgi:hypothetical protein